MSKPIDQEALVPGLGDMTDSVSPVKARPEGVRPGPRGDVPPARERRQGARNLALLGERVALPTAWLFVVILFTVLAPGTYLTSANIGNMLGSQAVTLVLTLGLMISLTVSEFDLSFAAVLGVSAMSLTLLNVRAGVPIVLCVIIVVCIGIIVGLVNAAIVVLLDISSLIVTLGTSTILNGFVFWISEGQTWTGLDPRISTWVVGHKILGIPLEFYYGLVLCTFLWYLYSHTPLGQRLLAIGHSREVARLSGIPVAKLRFGALIATSVISAVAGILFAATQGGTAPDSSHSFLMPAFAACFLGSTSIRPGRFNPWGTFIAVYFLVAGITGLQILGAQNYVQDLFYGGALVIAVVLARLSRRRRE